jgi:anti-sigma regulatory factor (Ser/Thr protein kinase)
VERSHGDYLRILSRPDWVEPVVLFLKDRAVAEGACDAAAANRLVVSMTEAITNAVVHGNYELESSLKEQGDAFERALRARADDPAFVGRMVDIRADYLPDRCTWTVTDEGAGFDVEGQLAKLESDDPEVMLSSGRGITIMKAFVDDVSWSEGGRQVRLTVCRDGAAERRDAPRRRYVATITWSLPGGPTRTGIARDLSATGIAFVTTEPLALGAAVTVLLDSARSNGHPLTGRVVRSHHLSGGFHDTAVKFDAPAA